jgi:hypothetical protein
MNSGHEESVSVRIKNNLRNKEIHTWHFPYSTSPANYCGRPELFEIDQIASEEWVPGQL